MPIIASAEKKMRKDKKRTLFNKLRKEEVKKLIRQAKKDKKLENIKKAQSAIAKLAKIKVIHKNKASRMIAQIHKLTKKEMAPKAEIVKKKSKTKKS